MKIINQLLISALLTVLISNISNCHMSSSTLNVLYTVSGILFSVGLSLVITTIPNGVKNPEYIARIKHTIDKVKNGFLIEFALITFGYVLIPETGFVFEYPINDDFSVRMDFALYTGVVLIFSIVYFLLNFLEIHKLNMDIFDKINRETK